MNFVAVTYDASNRYIGNIPARQNQYASLGLDYSSIGSINSQLSIAPDYFEGHSPIQADTQHGFEKFQGINVGSRRLKDRLLNIGTEMNQRNKQSIKQRIEKTQQVLKDQNISSLSQNGLGMQAQGKLEMMLGKEGYKRFKNSRNDLFTKLVQQQNMTNMD